MERKRDQECLAINGTEFISLDKNGAVSSSGNGRTAGLRVHRPRTEHFYWNKTKMQILEAHSRFS